jgi:hypothetical protein
MEISEEDRAEVEPQLQMLKAKYGDKINPAAEDELCEKLVEIRQRVIAIRQVPLTSDDEPLLHFAPRPARRSE